MKKFIRTAVWLIVALTASMAYSQETRPMSNDAQYLTTAQMLIDRHFQIWNERNSEIRLALFATVYTPDLVVADYAAEATGYTAVNQLIERVQGQHEGFVFSPKPVSWNHGIGRVTWGFGPKDNPDQVRGEDIFTVRDGKLATLHVFLDTH